MNGNRETILAVAIGVVALVLYGLVGAQDFAEETRQAEENWQRPVVSETGIRRRGMTKAMGNPARLRTMVRR